MIRVVACAALAALATACVQAPARPLPDLGAFVAADAEWPRDRALVLEGPARISGTDGRFLLELHGPERFRLELDGPVPRTSVYDGVDAWTRTGRGPARRLVLLERDALLLLVHAISGAWRSPEWDASRSVIERTGARVRLAVDFPGPAPALELEVDEASGDVAAVRARNRGRAAGWRLAGWYERMHLRLPSRIEFDGNERAGSRLEPELARWVDADPTRLVLPRGAADATFDPSVGDLLEARRNEAGQVFVPVALGEGLERWFLLDTGASGIVVDDELARELDARTVGVVGAVGGAGRTFARLLQGHTLTVGPLTIDQPFLLGLDLDGLANHLDEPLAGIVGWDLFARAAVELTIGDDPPRVRIRPPGGFDGTVERWHPAVANDAIVAVRGRVEDRPRGWFVLDTGAAWWAAIHSPWLARYDLPGTRTTTPGSARGIVRGARTLVVDLRSLELVGAELRDVPTHLSLAPEGSLADAVTVGNVGVEALRAHTLVLDLARERVALRAR